ncbi:unnamed protein product [Phytomonas sp. EM1]|nr:unnamed protein product [Phytomonas sp. EM1]|eukprot:CCW65364.1 unnamed protein product [Phytomonas sp. isolate EM1]
MNLLENLIHVTLDFGNPHVSGDWSASTEKQLDNLVPRQLLSVRLRISFKNMCDTGDPEARCGGGDSEGVAPSTLLNFLSHVGENNFVEVWKKLFEWVVVVPFLIPRMEANEGIHAGLITSGDAGAFHFGTPPFWEERHFAQSAREGQRSSYWLASSAMEVQCSAFSAIEASVPINSQTSDAAISIPQSIVSEYIFNFTVPEIERALLDIPGIFAFVLILPFGIRNAAALSLTSESEYSPGSRNSPSPLLLHQRNSRYILMKVLFRSLLDSNSDNNDALFGRERGYFLPVGCHYSPIRVRCALDLMSVTFPLSNDRLLLNLSITNASSAPITFYGATFDLYASDVWNPAYETPGKSLPNGEGPSQKPTVVSISSSEQRLGPSGASLRTIDVLTKIVTITPMLASDDRPPVFLQPQETYSFQFVVEVIPQLCYLLNPESLQYVYEAFRRDEDPQKTPLDRTDMRGDAIGGARGCRWGSVGRCAETVVIDCYGSPVATEELLHVLHSSYVSQVYVYYSLGFSARDGSGDAQSDTLHTQHSAQWSFVA